MCRFLAYLGPSVGLEELVWGQPHSIVRQSWAPRQQRAGAVNADGFGLGWYDLAVRPEPARWRSPRPAWAERSFRSVAGLLRTTCALAAVRDATPPSPIEESGTPPFTAGPWLFAHNGAVPGFTGPLGVRLRHMVSDTRAAGIEGASDSEVLFALTLDRLDAGADPGTALAGVVADVVDLSGVPGPSGPLSGVPGPSGPLSGVTAARLNLVLTDGRRLAATAWGDSLFVLESDKAVVVASEPYDDDPRWKPVPGGSLVGADASGATVTPLTPAGRSRP